MSYPPATTSHHHHPPPHLPRLACPGGGSCFLPRILAKIPQFLSHSSPSILYEIERNFFSAFLQSKMRVLGFRRGKTLFAIGRVRCLPFCAKVNVFFLQIFVIKCVFAGFVEVKRLFHTAGPSKVSQNTWNPVVGLSKMQ